VEAGNYPAIILDRPMFAVYVPAPGAAPIGPFAISPGGLMRVQALLFPALAERLNLPLPMAGAGNAPRVGGLPSETRNLPASALRDADPNFVPTLPQGGAPDRATRRGGDYGGPPDLGGKGQTGYGLEPGSPTGYGRPSLPGFGQNLQHSGRQTPQSTPSASPSPQSSSTAASPGAVQQTMPKSTPTPSPSPSPVNPNTYKPPGWSIALKMPVPVHGDGNRFSAANDAKTNNAGAAHSGMVSNAVRPGGRSAQSGRSRVKIAIWG
jgi:hypothetical protein